MADEHVGPGVPVRFPSDLPPIAGYADGCSLVDRGGGSKEIVFFDSAAQKVLVRMVVDRGALLDRLWGTSSDFYETAMRFLDGLALKPAELTDPPNDLSGRVPIACNVFRAFQAGTEAAFEGYYVSPGEIHLAKEKYKSSKSKKPIGVVPICHVQLSLPLLVGLLSKVKEEIGR
jgi:hypothetical protein